MIVNNQEELNIAGYSKEPIIELMPGDYGISDFNIDWALKLIMNAGTTLTHTNCQINGVPVEDFVLYCEIGISTGYLNGYEDPVGEV